MADSRSMSNRIHLRLDLRDFDNADVMPAANFKYWMKVSNITVTINSPLPRFHEKNWTWKRHSLSLKRLLKSRKFHWGKVISSANIEVLERCNDKLLGIVVTFWSLSPSSNDSCNGGAKLPFSHYMLLHDHDQKSSFVNQHYKSNFIQKEPIGEGGFSKVYKVEHKLDEVHYAIKKIKVTKMKFCTLKSMQKEIHILACLDHHNVVGYHRSWYGEENELVSQQPLNNLGSGINSYFYIQMELCSSTLRTWLNERNEKISKTKNQFDVVNKKENQNIYVQILEGMNYIHGRGILHRDVAPKNIFLSDKDDGHPLVKIGDFGQAREDYLTELKTRDQDLDESSEDPSVPPTYTSDIGTKNYASPEQLACTAYDNKSDMYSIGLILFELYHPFGTGMERHTCLQKLRAGNIPEELEERWPAQHLAIQHLTRQKSQERPSASDLLSGDTFPSQDKIIQSLEEMIQRLKKGIAQRNAEISQPKENRIPKT